MGKPGDSKYSHTWIEGIQACQSQQPTTVSSGCSKCGTLKSGELSCCSRGGSWFKKCGKPGDSKYSHTWTEGIQACQSQQPTKVSSGCSKCSTDKSGKRSCCFRGGSWFKKCGKPG